MSTTPSEIDTPIENAFYGTVTDDINDQTRKNFTSKLKAKK